MLIKDRDPKRKCESLPPPASNPLLHSNRRSSQEVNEYVIKLNNIMSDMEYEIVGSALLTTSIEDKKAQLEKARRLRNKVKEVRDAYETMMSRLEDARSKVADVIESNDRAYRDHLLFKESCAEFAAWLRAVKDKVMQFS